MPLQFTAMDLWLLYGAVVVIQLPLGIAKNLFQKIGVDTSTEESIDNFAEDTSTTTFLPW